MFTLRSGSFRSVERFRGCPVPDSGGIGQTEIEVYG